MSSFRTPAQDRELSRSIARTLWAFGWDGEDISQARKIVGQNFSMRQTGIDHLKYHFKVIKEQFQIIRSRELSTHNTKT